MRKGKGQLTYCQIKKQNDMLWRTVIKPRNDYNSLVVAHNKLLKETGHDK